MEIKLHIRHGCAFVRVHELAYFEGDLKDITVDLDELSLHEIKVDIKKLGYVERKIEEVCYRKPNMYFKEALVSIEEDDEVRELIKLCMEKPHIDLYMEHLDCKNWVEMSNVFNTQQHELDSDENDGDDDLLNDFDIKSESDDELATAKQKVREENEEKKKEVMIKAKLSRGKGSYDDDEFLEHYHDSDNASSPSASKDEEGNATRGKTIAFPKLNPYVRAEDVDVVVEINFIDKKQLREALEDYRILRGYDIKV